MYIAFVEIILAEVSLAFPGYVLQRHAELASSRAALSSSLRHRPSPIGRSDRNRDIHLQAG